MAVSRHFRESISTDVDHGEVSGDEGLVVGSFFGIRGQASGVLRLWEAIRESQTVDVAENWSEISGYVDCHIFFFILLDDRLKQYFAFIIATPNNLFELELQQLREVKMG